jgi:hypothetical protein
MKYLLLLNRVEDDIPEPGTPEGAEVFAAYQRFNDEMKEAGAYRDCQPLRGQSATTTVRVRGGETLITDGPAAEIKEQLGGYAIVECDDLDEALRWAARSPAARDASVEVHPVVTVEAPM